MPVPMLLYLPSEPFAFGEVERVEFSEILPEIPAVKMGRIHCIDGSLITWHGTRLARALRELPTFLDDYPLRSTGCNRQYSTVKPNRES